MPEPSSLSIENNDSTSVRSSTHSKRATDNYILNALPEEDYARLAPDLEAVDLTVGQVIYSEEAAISHLYFSSNSMVVVIATLERSFRRGQHHRARRHHRQRSPFGSRIFAEPKHYPAAGRRAPN